MNRYASGSAQGQDNMVRISRLIPASDVARRIKDSGGLQSSNERMSGDTFGTCMIIIGHAMSLEYGYKLSLEDYSSKRNTKCILAKGVACLIEQLHLQHLVLDEREGTLTYDIWY